MRHQHNASATLDRSAPATLLSTSLTRRGPNLALIGDPTLQLDPPRAPPRHFPVEGRQLPLPDASIVGAPYRSRDCVRFDRTKHGARYSCRHETSLASPASPLPIHLERSR